MRKQIQNSDFTQTRIDSDVLYNAGQVVVIEDDMAALLRKVLDSKYLGYGIPDWVLQYPIPPGTVPSNLPPAKAWMEAMKLKKKLRIGMHPCNTLENLLTISEVVVQGDTLTYTDDKKNPVVVPNVRGYHITDTTNTAPVVAAAYVADIVPYFAKCDGEKSVSPSITVDDEKNLKMMRKETTGLRKALTGNTKSEVLARDVIYKYMEFNADQAFAACNQLCLAHPNYAARSDVALTYYNECRKKDPKLVPLEAVLLPVPGKIDTIPVKVTLDAMYRFMKDVHHIRGMDGGISALSIGYVFGCCTRSMVKNVTHFLDIRQVLEEFKCNVVAVMGKMPEFVKRMLVANRYFVLDSSSVNVKTLTHDLWEKGEFGVYGSVSSKVQYGIYFVAESKPPQIEDTLVKYETLNIGGLFTSCSVPSQVVFHAVRAHMHPTMGKNFKYGILPCALPHNGTVIVTSISTRSIKLDDLIKRSITSNHHRNNWLITRRSWALLDSMSAQVGYMNKYVLPKMMTREKKPVMDWSTYFSEVKDDRFKMIEVDLKLNPLLLQRAQADPDESSSLQMIVDLMRESGTVVDTTVSLFKQWNDAQELPALRLLRVSGIPMDDVVVKLCGVAPDLKAGIMEGVVKLKSLREKAVAKVVERETTVPAISDNVRQNFSVYSTIAVKEDDDDDMTDLFG